MNGVEEICTFLGSTSWACLSLVGDAAFPPRCLEFDENTEENAILKRMISDKIVEVRKVVVHFLVH